ncbi:hypothetical protein GCM10009765_23560 [Fodinicola feengrottensis]|uniref:Uncharacterized protein n=1 Tax=Fodinicola feengrottensis TaxID=435914 RepID=A0ABN2GM62_9ACTN
MAQCHGFRCQATGRSLGVARSGQARDPYGERDRQRHTGSIREGGRCDSGEDRCEGRCGGRPQIHCRWCRWVGGNTGRWCRCSGRHVGGPTREARSQRIRFPPNTAASTTQAINKAIVRAASRRTGGFQRSFRYCGAAATRDGETDAATGPIRGE